MNPRTAPLLALLVGLITVGCAAGAREAPTMYSEPSVGVEQAAPGGFAAGDSFAPAEAPKAESPVLVSNVAAVERVVIQTASLTLVVPDPAASADEIADLADEMGGFVVSSNVSRTTFADIGVTADQGSIQIRVPAERLQEALERIKSGATEVRGENISGQDVTQEFTDLQSSLRNLEAAENQLLEIMGSATKTEDVLQVFEQLRQVRQEIEITKGRIQYLSESARLSSISVDLIPDAAAQPLQIGGWRPEGTAREAFTALIRALRFLAEAAIWAGICVLPVALILGVPSYFIGRTILRRRRAAKAKAKPADS
jgi:hypothetical protein